MHHHLPEVIFETATALELRRKLPYISPSGWWWHVESLFRIMIIIITMIIIISSGSSIATVCIVIIALGFRRLSGREDLDDGVKGHTEVLQA